MNLNLKEAIICDDYFNVIKQNMSVIPFHVALDMGRCYVEEILAFRRRTQSHSNKEQCFEDQLRIIRNFRHEIERDQTKVALLGYLHFYYLFM